MKKNQQSPSSNVPAMLPLSPLKMALFAAAISAFASTGYSLTQYTFTGGVDSTWATSGNWSGGSIAPTGSTFTSRRINMSGASLVYSATQGDTIYNNSGTDRGFVVTSGTLSFTGGSFTSNGAVSSEDVLGNSASTTTVLAVNGGNFTTNALTTNFSGGNATVDLNIQSGTATIGTLKVQALTGSTSTVNLDGGTLAVGAMSSVGNSTRNLNLNGGTLKATAAQTVTGFTNAFVKAGGAVIDTNGFAVNVSQALIADTVSTGGGLTKNGSGTLTLSGANTYTGSTTVTAGTLALGAADRIADSSNLVMNGGTLETGGFGETLGTLALTASSVIDLGSGASALVFADSSGVAWGGSLSLSFINFTEGDDSIRIGLSGTGLTSGQLGQISINGLAATIDGNGFLSISAIPEPSICAVMAALGALGFVVGARRRQGCRSEA